MALELPAIVQGYSVCTPYQSAGCCVCNAQGTAWTNDNSKCASGQTCQNWACVLTSGMVKNTIDSVNDGIITGWVCDPGNPGAEYWVEFYLDETTSAGYLGWSGMAAMYRYGIASQCGASFKSRLHLHHTYKNTGRKGCRRRLQHTIHVVAKKHPVIG